MRAQRTALLCLIAALISVPIDGAVAQRMFGRAPTANGRSITPMGPIGGGGPRGPGWGSIVPGIIMAVPQGYSANSPVIDDAQSAPRRPQRANQRGTTGAPPANERRLVPDEVVIELPNSVSAQQVEALQRRFGLTRIESQIFQLSNTTLYRWRIPDRRSVAAVVRALEGDRLISSAQPNYLFTLQESDARSESDPAQYELAKQHLPQAHIITKGESMARKAPISCSVPVLPTPMAHLCRKLCPQRPLALSHSSA